MSDGARMQAAPDMAMVRTVDELARLVGSRSDLHIRWSAGPATDIDGQSRDALTGVDLPGLSVNALAVEPWWDDRSTVVWVARRLYDYQHLRHQRGDVAWVLTGRECGRGPDNEPLLDRVRPVAWVADRCLGGKAHDRGTERQVAASRAQRKLIGRGSVRPGRACGSAVRGDSWRSCADGAGWVVGSPEGLIKSRLV